MTKPLNIILFIDSLANGGAQRQLVNLAIGLHRRGHTATVITYAPLNHHLPRLDEAGVAFECLHKQSRFDIKPVIRLYHAIKRLNADIVVAYLRTPSLYAELAGMFARKTSIVVSERAGITQQGLRIEHYLAGIAHTLATKVTGNSHHYIDALAKALPWLAPNSHVIYNGLDERFFINNSVRDCPTEYCRFCVVAARPTVEKGLLPLVQAVAKLVNSGVDNFSVHWIGPAPQSHELVQEAQAFIDQHSLQLYWHWEGEQHDVASCYPKYTALVLPSLHEGVANALCEAMASGLPVLTTNIADNARILNDGECGFLCKPNDPDSLAEILTSFIAMDSSSRSDMGKAAHARARELFDSEQTLNMWEDLLQSIKI